MQMYEVTALAPEGPEEVYREMVFAEDEDDALNQLEEQLKDRLERLIGEDGQIDSIRFSAKVEDGQLKVTAQAECQEEIGKEVPGSAPPEEHGESEEQASS